MSVAVVWFRRDLRLADHPALIAALRRHDAVVPLYVFDDALLRGRWDSGNRRFFLRESLVALDESLRARGSRLIWRWGPDRETVVSIAREVGAQAVYVSRDYSPYARRRDRAVAEALGAHGVAFHVHPGVLVHEPEDVRKPDGSPYTVYTPYRRAWERVALRPLAPTPDAIPTPPIDDPSPIPSLASLGGGGAATDIPAPSEAAAQQRLAAWARDGLRRYAGTRDRLDLAGTSRLSQDLRWGLLSPRQVIAACAGPDDDRQTFVGEIVWRDFYYHILYHFPRVATAAFQPRFDAIVWQATPDQIRAWQEGRTGYPVVDAAMRQLQATGWMHNRARMIVASFLTKDLLADWRVGERHFMTHLTDGDLASNNGGWQWAASTGTDAQPYFRIFNPVSQGQKFDPDGGYVRRWVPELARVATRFIHQPWTMPPLEQARVGCRIGVEYPAPIVDHARQRAKALAMYGLARGDASSSVADDQ